MTTRVRSYIYTQSMTTRGRSCIYTQSMTTRVLSYIYTPTINYIEEEVYLLFNIFKVKTTRYYS